MILFFVGCGKKYWPAPIVEEEIFKFSDIKGTITNNCIEVSGKITGNSKNIKEIVLEIESKGSCDRCPFLPDKKILISKVDKEFKMIDNFFSVRYCMKDSMDVSRIRLVGLNRFSQLKPSYSDVIVPKIEKGDM